MHCRFTIHPHDMVWECVTCHRRITEMTVRDCSVLVLRQTCGMKSRYDVEQRDVHEEPQHFHQHGSVGGRLTAARIAGRSNELIGQEGGRWDEFYMAE